MAQSSRYIKGLINNARREGSKTLDLQSFSETETLGAIPEDIFELSQLEELSLKGNQIRIVSERIRKLPNLKRLNRKRSALGDQFGAVTGVRPILRH